MTLADIGKLVSERTARDVKLIQASLSPEEMLILGAMVATRITVLASVAGAMEDAASK